MITECLDKDQTRKLYEDAFDDPKDFVDYYYSEKCKDNKIIVSIEEGEVLSMLHLNPYYMNLCGTLIKTYYVVAVATREDKRHQGHMSEVFKKTFEILKDEHIPFVFLLPVDEKIYSWMGFENICDFALEKIKDYEEIKKNYDVYCIWDETYLKRMAMEDKLREADSGEVLPDSPVIMAKITDLSAFNKAAGCSFISDKEALEFLKTKRIYICEEV
ncbi:MAG: GNAT family N-acetyltransferase [Butyrivibrio sp.]|nr:GNAT family N-acetyltransferase [Butyrivibrio sp.]